MSDHRKETREPPSDQQQSWQNNSLTIINVLYISSVRHSSEMYVHVNK